MLLIIHLMDVNDSSYWMYSGAVVKVCADSQQNNKNDCFALITGDFAKFHQILSKVYMFATRVFLVILSVFRQK